MKDCPAREMTVGEGAVCGGMPSEEGVTGGRAPAIANVVEDCGTSGLSGPVDGGLIGVAIAVYELRRDGVVEEERTGETTKGDETGCGLNIEIVCTGKDAWEELGLAAVVSGSRACVVVTGFRLAAGVRA